MSAAGAMENLDTDCEAAAPRRTRRTSQRAVWENRDMFRHICSWLQLAELAALSEVDRLSRGNLIQIAQGSTLNLSYKQHGQPMERILGFILALAPKIRGIVFPPCGVGAYGIDGEMVGTILDHCSNLQTIQLCYAPIAYGSIRTGKESVGVYARLGREISCKGENESVLYPPSCTESIMPNPLCDNAEDPEDVAFHTDDIAWTSKFAIFYRNEFIVMYSTLLSHARHFATMDSRSKSLDHMDIPARDLERLQRSPEADLIQTSLKSMRIFNLSLKGHRIDFSRFHNVKSLELIGVSRASNDTPFLNIPDTQESPIVSMGWIHHCVLKGCYINDISVGAPFRKWFKNLRSLVLDRCFFSDSESQPLGTSICRMIGHSPHLRCLKLHNCPNISALLDNTNQADEVGRVCTQVCNQVESNRRTLKVLSLGGVRINRGNGLRQFLSHVAPDLEIFHLSPRSLPRFHGYSRMPPSAIAPLLKVKKLRSVHLSDAKAAVTDSFLETLFRSNEYLMDLRISFCHQVTCITIENVVNLCPRLKCIHLRGLYEACEPRLHALRQLALRGVKVRYHRPREIKTPYIGDAHMMTDELGSLDKCRTDTLRQAQSREKEGSIGPLDEDLSKLNENRLITCDYEIVAPFSGGAANVERVTSREKWVSEQNEALRSDWYVVRRSQHVYRKLKRGDVRTFSENERIELPLLGEVPRHSLAYLRISQ